MVKLTFHQTNAETMVRAAATVIFNALARSGQRVVALSSLAEPPQYGFTASASTQPIGPRLVRITDLQDASIQWATVPYCDCRDPEKYLLQSGDLLFARTGATTGKTNLVSNPPRAVFASYLIRVRPKPRVLADYLYSFFQSDGYWTQIAEGREGSAQPNVNGRKLMDVVLPEVNERIQSAIASFVQAVRARQEGQDVQLPPLPSPLDEQRRIVARIEQLAAKIDEARHTQIDVIERCDALCRSMIFGKSGDAVVPTAMGTIVKLREPDIDVQREGIYPFAGVYCFGKGVFTGAAKSGMEFVYSRLTRLRAGDFVYPKLMAWEGALGVVPPDCDGLVVSPEFPVFEIDQAQVLPETLDVYFRTPSVWPLLAEISTGTNVRRRRLHPSAFLRFEMPLPKMERQLKLREVKRRVDTLKNLQAETAAVLDALLPSILDRAFRGELIGAVREPPRKSKVADILKQLQAGSTA